MACGVPVVASAVGGLVDSVVDGVTGVHVPPRRPGLLAAALAGLLADPARRAALGATGSRRARRRYGWDRIAGSTLDVYAALLAGLPTVAPTGAPAGAPAGVPAAPAGVAAGPGGARPRPPAAAPAGATAGAVDNREHRPPPSATLPLRGTSQPGVGFEPAPRRQSGRWSR
jgi:glycosyl transferase family 1